MTTVKTLVAAALAAAFLASGCERTGASSPAANSAVRTNDAIVAVSAADSPPYSYIDEKTGGIVGQEVEIAREAARLLGRKLELRLKPFDMLFAAVKSGEADMAISAITINDVRREDVDFSIPFATEGGSFLYRTGEKTPSMIVAETIRVGTVDAVSHDFYLSSHAIDPVRYRFYTDAVRDLEAGNIDAVYYDSNAVNTTAAESGGRFSATRLETRENFGVAVHKGMDELRAALDTAIERLKKGEK